MANATPLAAEHGWSAFTSSVPPPTRSEINEQLTARGLTPVSLRTYDHYKRLVRHGYTRYIPINELDVTVKASKRRQAS